MQSNNAAIPLPEVPLTRLQAACCPKLATAWREITMHRPPGRRRQRAADIGRHEHPHPSEPAPPPLFANTAKGAPPSAADSSRPTFGAGRRPVRIILYRTGNGARIVGPRAKASLFRRATTTCVRQPLTCAAGVPCWGTHSYSLRSWAGPNRFSPQVSESTVSHVDRCRCRNAVCHRCWHGPSPPTGRCCAPPIV